MSSAVLSNDPSESEHTTTPRRNRKQIHENQYCDSKGISLDTLLNTIQSKIAPLWPLKDFVAVNPFVGLTGQSFLDVSSHLERVCSGTMLPKVEYFFERIRAGEIDTQDLDQALTLCNQQYPNWYAGYSVERMLSIVPIAEDDCELKTQRQYFTAAECIDRIAGGIWKDRITDEVSKICSVHFDEGQAIWQSPWKGLPLYQAWREIATRDRRMEKWGVKNFRQWVSSLPQSPSDAISHLLSIANVPAQHAENWLFCQVLSISGWASHVRYRTLQDGSATASDNDLIGLIAIHLAYDVAVLQTVKAGELNGMWPLSRTKRFDDSLVMNDPSDSSLVGYWLQVSAEVAYRRQLLSVLATCNDADDVLADDFPAPPKRFQMVFCIDVRSELIRRHLEAVSDEIETFGFAGFFGVPMAYRPATSKQPVSQLPVLLSPAFEIQEGLRNGGSTGTSGDNLAWKESRRDQRLFGKVIKAAQSSATSCFSFVEAFGLTYFAHLALASVGIVDAHKPGRNDGVRDKDHAKLGPVLGCASEEKGSQCSGATSLDIESRAAIALSILKNLGLTQNFGRLVVLCGHTCQTVNNPYRAGLDCGACGGHSGEPNARVAADLLNDPQVRKRLSRSGIDVPADTRFLAAVHNTTTDEINFFDVAELPDCHQDDLRELASISGRAGQMTRLERAHRMGEISGDEVASRARFWSEVRPEWGLAGNAAFIVAPRSRTLGSNIAGRAFMHSYDHHRDTDGKVLELIMTAPMIVASWINLQYYASTVDNAFFGSGNKVLHNVVGQFGVLEGNAGDLRSGLPWQSVHDGKTLQHEPLRLSVVIEAPREAIAQVIEKHQSVRGLITGDWISLTAIDNSQMYRYASDGTWEEIMI